MLTGVQYLGIGHPAIVGVCSLAWYVGSLSMSAKLVTSYTMSMMLFQFHSPMISHSTSHMIISCRHRKSISSNSLTKLAYHMRTLNSSMVRSYRLLGLNL